MKYFLMPITNEEMKKSGTLGFAYASKNKDKWIAIDDIKDEINTYDRGTTVLVVNNVTYNIHKDYVNVTEKYRLYIGCDFKSGNDII